MQNLIFMSEKENVIIKMLRSKLSDTGVPSDFELFEPDLIASALERADIIVLYLDKAPEEYIKSLIALKVADAAEKCKRYIIIGDDAAKETVGRYINNGIIITSYSIPLDTVGFLQRTCSIVVKGYDDTEFDNKSILIVDDDASLMSTIRGWLKDKYKIQLCNTGMSARKWLQDNIPDLIILDYEMPLMSGPELFERLKEDDRLKDIPILFMTGKGDKDSVMKVMSLKPEGYLLKPVEKDKLTDAIISVFVNAKKR